MTEIPITQKPVHWFALQINGLVSIWSGPSHERANGVMISTENRKKLNNTANSA